MLRSNAPLQCLEGWANGSRIWNKLVQKVRMLRRLPCTWGRILIGLCRYSEDWAAKDNWCGIHPAKRHDVLWEMQETVQHDCNWRLRMDRSSSAKMIRIWCWNEAQVEGTASIWQFCSFYGSFSTALCISSSILSLGSVTVQCTNLMQKAAGPESPSNYPLKSFSVSEVTFDKFETPQFVSEKTSNCEE